MFRLFVLLVCSLYSLANESINFVQSIANTTHHIKYHFAIHQKDFFLIYENNNSNHGIWEFTKEKQWRPIHNAVSPDGFKQAGETFSNVSYDHNTQTLHIGSIDKNTLEDLSSESKRLALSIENQQLTCDYHFFNQKNIFYLAKEKNQQEFSIWHFTSRKEWRPIHNAQEIYQYQSAPKNYTSIVRNKNLLTIGDLINSSPPLLLNSY